MDQTDGLQPLCGVGWGGDMLILREQTLGLQEVQDQVRGFMNSLSDPLFTLGQSGGSTQVTALHLILQTQWPGAH